MSNHNYEYIKSKAQGIFAKLLRGGWADSDIREKSTYVATLFLMLALLLVGIGEARARPMVATAPGLGTAASFAVLGGSTVTNTGPTIVTGNLGVSPGSAVTGFPPGIVVPPSTIHTADAVALQAQSDVTTAYNDLAGQACDVVLTGQDLGGLTLTPAVYCFTSSAFLTGILTLDGQGDPNAVFVFQIGSTLITAPNSSVVMINGANACNVFWQVGSSATLDTTTAFQGNILALTSITLNTGASVYGRALARNGAVTMDSNTIPASCAVAPPTPTATSTNTPVGTSTNTPVATGTLLPTATGTLTPAATSIETPTVTPTGTNVPTALDPTGEPVVSQAVTIYLPLVVR
jgi:hypothetical protein